MHIFALFVATFFSISAPAKGVNPEIFSLIRYGMNKSEVEATLGKADEQKADLWIYGTSKDPLIQIQWNKNGKLEWAESAAVLPPVPPALPVQELLQEQKAHHTPATKFFAHPESGRVWQISIAGPLRSYIIKNPWKPKERGVPFEKAFKAIR